MTVVKGETRMVHKSRADKHALAVAWSILIVVATAAAETPNAAGTHRMWEG